METAVRSVTLLWGEQPETDYVEDAGHWVVVYSELLRGAEAAELNGRVVQLGGRLAFWRQRHKDLRDRSA